MGSSKSKIRENNPQHDTRSRGRRVRRVSDFKSPRAETSREAFDIDTETSREQSNIGSNDPGVAEKCYDPQDTTLTFVDGEDDLDFLCEGFKSRRALMSCGHAVTPMSLTNWCRKQLDQGKSSFVCGQPHCDVEWPYAEVRKMALLTAEEMEYFEQNMGSRTIKDCLDTKSCPGCNYYVVRKDRSNLCVCCTVCTTNKGQTYEFCWQCLKEWKGPQSRLDCCENDGCCNLSLETLKTCPDIEFEDVEGVTGCPSIRACIICGLLVKHNTKKCKNVICPSCKTEFCFVCLKLTSECSGKTESYYKQCTDGVAPRQTSIPTKQNE